MRSAEQLLLDAISHDSFKAACPKHLMMTDCDRTPDQFLKHVWQPAQPFW